MYPTRLTDEAIRGRRHCRDFHSGHSVFGSGSASAAGPAPRVLEIRRHLGIYAALAFPDMQMIVARSSWPGRRRGAVGRDAQAQRVDLLFGPEPEDFLLQLVEYANTLSREQDPFGSDDPVYHVLIAGMNDFE